MNLCTIKNLAYLLEKEAGPRRSLMPDSSCWQLRAHIIGDLAVALFG